MRPSDDDQGDDDDDHDHHGGDHHGGGVEYTCINGSDVSAFESIAALVWWLRINGVPFVVPPRCGRRCDEIAERCAESDDEDEGDAAE